MNKNDLLNLLKELALPTEEFYILSSGCLVLYNLREKAGDLDLCISEKLFPTLKEKYNISDDAKNECGFYQLNDQIEFVVNKKETFDVDIKDGYQVQKLESILEFKEKRNLEKDQVDIKNIKEYLINKIC